MENLSLIDVSSEDDLLSSSSADRRRDLRSSGLAENHGGHNFSVVESAGAHEEGNLVKMSQQWEHVPEMSESPEQKQAKSGKVNLRKSLAWDSAFFTNEGVLNTEELAIVNSTFKKTEGCSLPGIQEELQKSTESTSTLDSESYTLESLEGGLFENLRASIQMSFGKRDCSSGESAASCMGSMKKIEIPSQTKMKPPIALKRDGVNRQQLEHTPKMVILGKEGAKGSGNSKSILKPPRSVPKLTSLPTVPSNKDSSRSIHIKNNTRRTSSGNGANRQGTLAFSKTNGEASSMISTSISLLRPTPGTHQGTVVFSSASCMSNGSPVSSTSHLAGKSPSESTRKRSTVQNGDQSLSGSTNKTPVRASKSKLGPPNLSRLPTCANSTFKISLRASPSSSIDSLISEASSSSSTSIKPSNSVESLASSISSSHSFAVPIDTDAFQPADTPIVSTDQPHIKKEISANLLQSQSFAKASAWTRVSSGPSNRDHHSRSSININTGAKSFKPSGLRMPSPKLGYFDAEKTLVSNSNIFSQIGLRNSVVKGNNGTSDTVGANKPKSTKIPSIRPAAQHACMKSHQSQSASVSPDSWSPASPLSMHQQSPMPVQSDTVGANKPRSSKIPSIRPAAQHACMKSHQSQSASLAPHSKSPASPLSMHQQSKPMPVQNDSSPMTDEVNKSMVSNGSVKVADGVLIQPTATLVSGNGSPYSGEGGSDVTHKGAQATCQFDKEENPGKITCLYNQEGYMANESHSVSKKIQKENLFPVYEPNSPSEGQKISLVDIMDKKMPSLSF